MNLPDRIVAIGGAGKAIAYELLEADWVRESVLEPRHDPRSLRVTIVDTAENERNRDRERIREIRRQVEETREQFDASADGRPGEIEIEYLLVTDNVQLHDQNDLIGETTVPRITAGRGMDPDDWWLESDHITENLDFATGVVRKRSLGKAIYYKAYAEDDSVSTAIDLPTKGKVAVLVGLGGGTGSGVFLDLVRDLKQTKRTAEITLFAVLPNDEEPRQENANAHAALSELEYMSLTGQDVFEDRVLLSITPTGFGGKTGNMIQSSEPLTEFDRAAIYTVVSYYNMRNMEDPFADLPSYAPFVVAVPQVLRYNVDAIKRAKESIQELLARKENALEAEEAVYTDVDRFLSKHYSVDVPTEVELNDSDRSDLEERLESVEALLDLDLFTELDYRSVSAYREIIRDARREADDVAEQVEIVSGSLRAGSAQPRSDDEQFVDAIDQQLAAVLEDELGRLAFRKEVVERLQTVENNRIRGTLSYLVGREDDTVNPGVRLNRLEAKAEEASDRQSQLESDLQAAREELDREREKQSSTVQRRLDEWTAEIRPLYDNLAEARSVDTDRLVADLESEIRGFADEIEDCETVTAVDRISDADVRQRLTELDEAVSPLGIDISQHKRDVVEATTQLADLKQAFLKMNEDESVVERLTPWQSSTAEERRDAEKTYNMNRSKLDEGWVFGVTRAGSSLDVAVELDADRIVSDVGRTRDETIAEILSRFRDAVGDGGQQFTTEFESELRQGASFDRLRDVAERAFTAELDGIDDIESRVEELESELATVREEVSLYEATVELFQEVNNGRERFVEGHTEFVDGLSTHDDREGDAVATDASESLYVKPTKPHDVLRVSSDDDIAESRLFDDEQERTRLRGHLEQLARRSYDPKYTGLLKRRISSDRSRFEHTQVVVGVVSRAVKQIADVADLEDVFEGAYDIGSGGSSSGFASFAVPTGGGWDVGLGMFIGGVFLDNLRKVTDADGYYDDYERIETSDDTDISVHHTLGLEEGHYVRRADLRNMENPADVRFFLQDDATIREELLDRAVERVPVDRGEQTATQQSSDTTEPEHDE